MRYVGFSYFDDPNWFDLRGSADLAVRLERFGTHTVNCGGTVLVYMLVFVSDGVYTEQAVCDCGATWTGPKSWDDLGSQRPGGPSIRWENDQVQPTIDRLQLIERELTGEAVQTHVVRQDLDARGSTPPQERPVVGAAQVRR